jgi:hypothetical protein
MLRNLLLLVSLLLGSSATAGGIVLESYTGERPADASRLLGPVLDELSRRDYATGETVARAYEAQVSQPAVRPGGVPADFAAQVDRGFKAWVSGRFDEAVKVLVPLVETAHANTGVIARDPSLRDPLLKAQIALALAYLRIGDLPAMRTTFGAIIRSFPDAQISRATYGPDAHQAFDQVRRDVQAAGRGKLIVKLADESGVVFVDETYRAVGSTSLDLPPGEYRVIVMMHKQPSRNHRVTVRANAEASIDIDAKLDQAVRTTGYTGFAFETQGEREAHEARFAQHFARAIGASAVAVVGIADVRGRAAVVGSLVSLQSGREIRRASIAVEPDPSRDKLRALARFLAGDDPAPGLDVQFTSGADDRRAADGAASQRSRRDDGGSDRRWGGWRWLTAGLAVGGLGTGVVLIALDGACLKQPPAGQQCADYYHTSVGGYAALGGSVLMGALSIYLFATHDRAPVVTPTPGGATLSFATRF